MKLQLFVLVVLGLALTAAFGSIKADYKSMCNIFNQIEVK